MVISSLLNAFRREKYRGFAEEVPEMVGDHECGVASDESEEIWGHRMAGLLHGWLQVRAKIEQTGTGERSA